MIETLPDDLKELFFQYLDPNHQPLDWTLSWMEVWPDYAKRTVRDPFWCLLCHTNSLIPDVALKKRNGRDGGYCYRLFCRIVREVPFYLCPNHPLKLCPAFFTHDPDKRTGRISRCNECYDAWRMDRTRKTLCRHFRGMPRVVFASFNQYVDFSRPYLPVYGKYYYRMMHQWYVARHGAAGYHHFLEFVKFHTLRFTFPHYNAVRPLCGRQLRRWSFKLSQARQFLANLMGMVLNRDFYEARWDIYYYWFRLWTTSGERLDCGCVRHTVQCLRDLPRHWCERHGHLARDDPGQWALLVGYRIRDPVVGPTWARHVAEFLRGSTVRCDDGRVISTK